MKHLLVLCLLAAFPLSASAKRENFKASAADTKITWEGKKKIGDNHHGTLALKSGKFVVDKDAIVGGEFEIDMTSLKVTDVTNEGMNKKLTDHLRSDDFFSIAKSPTASLKITKATKKGDNYEFTGDLTIKGIKKPISFPAVVHKKKDGLHATANISVDRTAYEIKYNSLKFFNSIGDKAIEDHFTVSVDISAKK